MATVDDWNKYINVLHELALVEDDLRTAANTGDERWAYGLADQIMYERFGLDKP